MKTKASSRHGASDSSASNTSSVLTTSSASTEPTEPDQHENDTKHYKSTSNDSEGLDEGRTHILAKYMRCAERNSSWVYMWLRNTQQKFSNGIWKVGAQICPDRVIEIHDTCDPSIPLEKWAIGIFTCTAETEEGKERYATMKVYMQLVLSSEFGQS